MVYLHLLYLTFMVQICPSDGIYMANRIDFSTKLEALNMTSCEHFNVTSKLSYISVLSDIDFQKESSSTISFYAYDKSINPSPLSVSKLPTSRNDKSSSILNRISLHENSIYYSEYEILPSSNQYYWKICVERKTSEILNISELAPTKLTVNLFFDQNTSSINQNINNFIPIASHADHSASEYGFVVNNSSTPIPSFSPSAFPTSLSLTASPTYFPSKKPTRIPILKLTRSPTNQPSRQEYVFVYVNDVTDTEYAVDSLQSSSCASHIQSSNTNRPSVRLGSNSNDQTNHTCNLRSAIAYCASQSFASLASQCIVQVSIPHANLQFNPTIGMIVLNETNVQSSFTLSIQGNNAIIAPNVLEVYASLLYINVMSSPFSIKLHISNLTMSYFYKPEDNGGAIHINGVANAVIENCVFQHNVAKRGGAVYLATYCMDNTIRNCRFYNNTAQERGGGLYSDTHNDNLLIDSCIFDNNVAIEGGGININEFHYNLVTSNSTFVGNRAYEGGGIRFARDNDQSLVIDCLFKYNKAILDGKNNKSFCISLIICITLSIPYSHHTIAYHT